MPVVGASRDTSPEAPDDWRVRATPILTTEHFNLQSARSATIADASGRENLSLGFVSLALVALALVGQASALETAFFLFGLVLIPILIPRNGTGGTGAGTTGIAVIAAETGGHPLRQKRHYRLLVALFEIVVPLPYRSSVTRSPRCSRSYAL